MYEPEAEEALGKWSSSKYAVLAVDVSTAHTDADLANIATHHPSGDAFSWEEFTNINWIKDIQHPVDYSLKLADTGNDRVEFSARGQNWERIAGVLEGSLVIYFTNTATTDTDVLLLLEGW